MKILITGAEGQLGTDCKQVLARTHHCVAMGKSALDVSNSRQVRDALESHRPQVLLNCAAFTKVDACETEQDLAWRINAEAPKILAIHCEELGVKLVHISTDYVFNGKKSVPNPYVETDATEPLCYYGVSKLAGEQAIVSVTDRFLIIRTAWLYGMGGPNFLKTMLRLALMGKDIRVVNDQFGSLTWTYRLAQQIKTLLQTDARGIYHATAEGFGSWYDTARLFLSKMDHQYHLSPCKTSEYKTAARRPANSILENRRLKQEGLNVMKDWQHDVEQFVLHYKYPLMSEMKGIAA
jgi:dTDP-4-dehydrorhamnose reductase